MVPMENKLLFVSNIFKLLFLKRNIKSKNLKISSHFKKKPSVKTLKINYLGESEHLINTNK